MASGKAVGEFSFKLVAINNSPGPAGNRHAAYQPDDSGT